MWWNKAKRAVPVKAPVMPALAMALEPRMLFDGAVAATMAEAADAKPTADTAAKVAQAHPSQDNSVHEASKDNLSAVPAGTSDHRQEVVFVDASVKGYQQLVAGLKPGTEVVVLDANKDGLQQIADYLQGRSGIDSIHILSHGDVGKVQLGNTWLDGSSIALRSDLLTSIGQADGWPSLDTQSRLQEARQSAKDAQRTRRAAPKLCTVAIPVAESSNSDRS